MIRDLRDAIEDRFECTATLCQIVPVEQRREDGSVWDGTVAVFSLTSHRSAEVAYAWYDPGPTAMGRRVCAVLQAGPVDSAEAAVRLSMTGWPAGGA